MSANKYLKDTPSQGRNEESYTSYRDGEVGRVEQEEGDAFEDSRWDKITNSFNRGVETLPGADRPEFRRWNKQENWGKKTWKEASETTVPKLVGEGIYGVGPVLAAVCAGRRELYALNAQQGSDLSGNSRKKKDNKY